MEASSTYVHDDVALVDLGIPSHLAEAVGQPPLIRQGAWSLDLGIERHNDLSRFLNVKHQWVFPKVNGIHSLFLPQRPGRISEFGTITTFVEVTSARAQLLLPTDEEFFRAVLHPPGSGIHGDLRGTLLTEPPYRLSRLSDKGRYLLGVLRITKGLNNATQIVDSAFWREFFLDMVGPIRAVSQEALMATSKRLKRKLGFDGVQKLLKSDEDWDRVAEVALVEARNIRMRKTTAVFSEMKNRWRARLERVIEKEPALLNDAEAAKEEGLESFDSSLESLCEAGLFTQGYRWTCKQCLHNNWLSVGALSSMTTCEVCGRNTGLPAQFEWSFALNDFFALSVREHGVLALLHTLSILLRDADSSFVFSPPRELFEKYPEDQNDQASCEIDLVCVIDGKLVFGEVKSSDRHFTGKDEATLIELAVKYRPDIVVLSCPENTKRFKSIAERVANGIGKTGAKLRVIVPEDEHEAYYLPEISDGRSWIRLM